MSSLLYVLLALLMLGVLITLHEFGHFIASRLTGIEVMEFSAGMGPLICQKKSKKGTMFSLRAIPVGGYCRYYDEEDGEPDFDYSKKPVWKRAVATASGPLMNFLAAFLIVVLFLSVLGQQMITNQVGHVEENMPAQEAGLLEGDTIVAVGDTRTENTNEISALIAQSGYEPVSITVLRDGKELTFTMEPKYDAEASRYRVGVEYRIVRYRMALRESIPASFQWNVNVIRTMCETLVGLFTRGEGVDELSGPVGTVYVIQEATRQGGIDMYLLLAAMISANLGFMNLLPIPGLDGSRLIFLLIEAIRRKPVDRRIEGTVYMIGFAFLIGLMLLLTFQDVTRIFL